MVRVSFLLSCLLVTVPGTAGWRVLDPHDGRQPFPPGNPSGGKAIQPGDAWPQDHRFRWLVGDLVVPAEVDGRPTPGRPIGLRFQCGDGGEVWIGGKLRSRFDNDHPALILLQERATPGTRVRVGGPGLGEPRSPERTRGRDDYDEEAVRRFEAYCKLHRATASGVLRADPDAKVGGPAIASGPFEHDERGHGFHGKGFARGLMFFCEEEKLPHSPCVHKRGFQCLVLDSESVP
jgi:hypothetical protein